MEEINKILMEILCAFANNESLSRNTIESAAKAEADLFELASYQSVAGIVGYKITEYIDSQETCPHGLQVLRARARDAFYQTITLTTERDILFQTLEGELNNEGIDYLPLKGIVIKDYYPVPELRTFGDIDFAVRDADRDRAHALMLRLGYECVIDHGDVYNYRRGREYYEMHRNSMNVHTREINKRSDFEEYFSDFWKYAVKTNGHRYTLPPEIQLVYLFVHIAKHIYHSGAGIRMYMDLALYIKKTPMDWDKVVEGIEKVNLRRFFDLIIQCLEDWFGTKLPVPVSESDPKLRDEFLTYSLSDDVFGQKDAAPAIADLRNTTIKHSSLLRLRTMTRLMFPAFSDISEWYPCLKKHPYLLPVIWAKHYIFANFFRLSRRLAKIKTILTTKNDKINETVRFYKNIGL